MILDFDADQPHRFADYSFWVIRGNGNPIAGANAGGQVPVAGTIITPTGPVDCQVEDTLMDMLGTCTRGAFSENVYVTAYHTNATTRVQGYDSSRQAAFAVEPAQ
jgi:hypothetical protein